MPARAARRGCFIAGRPVTVALPTRPVNPRRQDAAWTVERCRVRSVARHPRQHLKHHGGVACLDEPFPHNLVITGLVDSFLRRRSAAGLTGWTLQSYRGCRQVQLLTRTDVAGRGYYFAAAVSCHCGLSSTHRRRGGGTSEYRAEYKPTSIPRPVHALATRTLHVQARTSTYGTRPSRTHHVSRANGEGSRRVCINFTSSYCTSPPSPTSLYLCLCHQSALFITNHLTHPPPFHLPGSPPSSFL